MSTLLPTLRRYAWLLLLLFVKLPVQAQAPTWQSAVTFEQTTGSDLYPNRLLAGGNGNLLLAGAFTGTVRFGATTLTSLGGSDLFVAK